MYNNTKKSWILARDIPYWKFGTVKEQNKILAAKSRNEGYTVIGYSSINSPVNQLDSMKKMQNLISASSDKKIDALFVFNIRYISENLNVVFRFIDKMNGYGVVVCDIDGNKYSYDWMCKQIGKRFKI